MSLEYITPDPLERELEQAMGQIAAGRRPGDLETRRIDFKEEAGRRDPSGSILEGHEENDAAVLSLLPEVACLANTPGAGVLVLGLGNMGERIGTALDAEWLRHELYRRSDRRLTVDVRAAAFESIRLLVLRVPEAVEPIRYNNRIQWRVDDNCVDVDAASWASGRLLRLGYDWSAQESAFALADARPAAVERARQFLLDADEPTAADLAAAPTADLLRRLNVVSGSGRLTQAGALLFVGRGLPALDFLRRDVPGGDSLIRLHAPNRALLEELYDVVQAVAAGNVLVHLANGLSIGQVRQLPPLAVREAIVNGITHRDWESPDPTTVEHVGTSLTVSSPGGFVGGVRPDNIITHPSTPRYRALSETMAALRVAEREGIGVDRMVREMVRQGYPAPEISELDGPRVRAVLVGGRPDEAWLRFLSGLQPTGTGDDLDVLLLLRRLFTHGWVDVVSAAPVLQRSQIETADAVARLEASRTAAGDAVVTHVAGVPTGDAPAWRPANAVRRTWRGRVATGFGPGARRHLAIDWAMSRGRISTTELGDLVGVAANAVGPLLRSLEDEGLLTPSRANRLGRGFHYLPVRG